MSLSLKPTHATVKAYYDTLHEFGQLYIDHEGAVRSAFQALLAKCGQRTDPKLTLVPEYRIKRARGATVILEGALDATPNACHPEAPSFGAGGPMHPAGSADAADQSIGPPVRKKRGPQDDNAKPPVSFVSPW